MSAPDRMRRFGELIATGSKTKQRARQPFAQLPKVVLQRQDLKAGPKLLYARIHLYCLKSGECWASNATLAAELNVTARTIQRWLRLLERAGLIEVSKRVGATNCLRLPPLLTDLSPALSTDR